MSLLVESIRIVNGKIRLIDFHNARANASRKILFGSTDQLNLYKQLRNSAIPQSGEVKCRVLYGEKIEEISFQPYVRKEIKHIQIMAGGDIKYQHKWVERPQLDELFYKKASDVQEICILDEQDYVTDGYYYNYVFEKDGQLFTPITYLLPGVMRASLIAKGRVIEVPIHINDVSKFEFVHLINAMNPPGKIVLPTSALKYST